MFNFMEKHFDKLFGGVMVATISVIVATALGSIGVAVGLLYFLFTRF